MAGKGGIVVDLKRMDRILEINELSGVAVIQPGIIGQHLEDQLNARGFTLGHFPSSLMTATVGGYVATRSAGQLSSRYGKIEDMLVSMRFVAGSGEIFDTKAQATTPGAPDLNQIIMGSEGTLGIITETRLKVHPVPTTASYRGLRFQSLEDGLNAMRRIMQAGLRPSVVRLYDEIDTYLVGRGDKPLPPAEDTLEQASSGETVASSAPNVDTPAPQEHDGPTRGDGISRWVRQLTREAKGVVERHPELARGVVRVALSRPELVESMTQRFLPQELLLVLGFEGEPEEVEATEAASLEICAACHRVDLGPEPGLRWLKKRYDVSFKMPQFFHMGAFTDTCEVAATWEKIPDLYKAVRAAVSEYVVIMAHFSHAYPEGISIYFSLAGPIEDPLASEKRYAAAWKGALETVLAHGGTVSHHHGVGQHKAPYVTREQGAFVSLFKPLKAQLDPDWIMNPGKLYTFPDEPATTS